MEKPKFVSKRERERLRKEKEGQEEKARLQAETEAKKKHEKFLQEAAGSSRDRYSRDSDRKRYSRSRSRSHDRYREKDRYRESDRRRRDNRDRGYDRRRKDRDRERNRDRDREDDRERDRYRNDRMDDDRIEDKTKEEKSRNGTEEKSAMETYQEQEIEEIKGTYLGTKKPKKRIIRPSDKFRNIFNFQWDDSEDTYNDTNPLYQKRLEPQLLYGRGYKAGIDIKEQRQKALDTYDSLLRKRDEGEKLVDSNFKEVHRRRKAEENSLASKYRDIGAKVNHWSSKVVEEFSERDWRIFREDHNIMIKGGRVPNPILSWQASGLPQPLIESIHKIGYETPTAIQLQGIPIGLIKRDLIGIAETGSGKTAAYVLPLLAYVMSLPPLDDSTAQDGPYGIVLAPTRELAIQINEETQKFAQFLDIRTAVVVGGRSIEEQASQLRRGVEILIGTPGRIKDCLDRAFTVLNQCLYLVLDEADEMISLGLEETVNQILDALPATTMKSDDEKVAEMQEQFCQMGEKKFRITQMFSATMPPACERIAQKYLKCPSFISVGDPGAGKKDIEQRVVFANEKEKKSRLQQIMRESEPPIMVFVNEKKRAEDVARLVEGVGYRATILHGGKSQDAREAALNDFKKGLSDVLVSTNVAGRGIDVEGVTHVVNFDCPKKIDEYTHRIGRTGRAGKRGIATSFLTAGDEEIMYDLKQFLIQNDQHVPSELAHHQAAKIKSGGIPDQAARWKQVVYKN
eukprot:CAMPEP_0115033094 /NCGR_PEP_ID=MMETSP0216-20121206/39612_1 /TAXON_ID=223996 /ORGANISM="Protocruzia adherens, Strain Boccale" /LENGTH=740 /DNA_ID=CAMNT_0002411245 /DNA_START=34 /DNA_END=2256 /DNA_ORIENTATION=+